jgi:hypothetical protein
MGRVNYEQVATARLKMRQVAKKSGMAQEEIGLRIGLAAG